MRANAANSCGKTTAIKQNIHVSNGFNHSVSITNRVQRSAQVKLEPHSGTFFPVIPEESKLNWPDMSLLLTSPYLTWHWQKTESPKPCGNVSIIQHCQAPWDRTSTRRKRLRCQRCSPPWEQVSLWAVSWCYKPSVHQKTQNTEPTRSLVLIENL